MPWYVIARIATLIVFFIHYAAAFSATVPEKSTAAPGKQTEPFLAWISDSTEEVAEWRKLSVEGNIPSYVNGSLVRNGGGTWSAGDSSYTHIFDGLAKVSAWKIDDGDVFYRNRFIQSDLYKTATKEKKLPPTITAGPPVGGSIGPLQSLQAVLNSAGMDNAPVNIWDFSPLSNDNRITARTDAPARADLALDDLSTVDTVGMLGPPVEGFNGVVILETTHPLYSLSDDEVVTYNIATTFSFPGGLEVALIRETADGVRTVVASQAPTQGNVPYIHSFGVTDRYAVAIVQPLRLDWLDLSTTLAKGFLRAMKEVPKTEVIVFDLEQHDVVFHESTDEKVFFYHSISSVSERNERGQVQISVRLCAYRNADMICGEHHFMRLDQARKGADLRNKITKGGQFCDIIGNLDTNKVRVEWMDSIKQGFELPTTRHSRDFRTSIDSHPRYVYAYGAYADGSTNYDDWGLFKYDLEQKKIDSSFIRPLLFPSEPIFVADPQGKDEDDGVILTQVYDGARNETGLFVLDASNMEMLATAFSNHRSPMDFHGGWVPRFR